MSLRITKGKLAWLVVYLLLGAVINFVIAFRIGSELNGDLTAEADVDRWRHHWSPGPDPDQIYSSRGIGWDITRARWEPSDDRLYLEMVFEDAGLPFRSLHATCFMKHGRFGHWECTHGKPAGGFVEPMTPIPLGFAANTLFYAGVLFAPVLAFRGMRRERRIERGCCAACGYDLAGASGTCPECGRAI